MMTEANADLTCWLASDTKSLTQGKMFVIITDSFISGDRLEQNSGERKIISGVFKYK
jgi:hypothetical protein